MKNKFYLLLMLAALAGSRTFGQSDPGSEGKSNYPKTGSYTLLTNDLQNLPVFDKEELYPFIEKNRKEDKTVLVKFNSRIWVKIYPSREVNKPEWKPFQSTFESVNESPAQSEE